MASMIYPSCLADALAGKINFVDDNFAVMLASSYYDPDENHSKRSDIDSEVFGVNYAKGGKPVILQVIQDNQKNRIDVDLGSAAWIESTLTARYAIYYKSRGGDPYNDELIAVIDFGGEVVSENGAFSLTNSTLRLQN